MLKKLILPLGLGIVGTAAGLGAGFMLKPDAELETELSSSDDHGTEDAKSSPKAPPEKKDAPDAPKATEDYIKLQNQFVVPVIHDGKMAAMVIMSLGIEATASTRDVIIKKTPKLRDSFLRVMFNHANLGGFDGNFIENGPMTLLERSLLDAAQSVIDPTVSDVLILEIARQDLG